MLSISLSFNMTAQGSQSLDVYDAPDLQSFIANLPQEIIDEVSLPSENPSKTDEAQITGNTTSSPAIVSEPQEVKPKNYLCTDCNRVLTRHRYLSSHRFRHMPYADRPYGCTKCFKKYVTKWSLARHLKLKHSDDTDVVA